MSVPQNTVLSQHKAHVFLEVVFAEVCGHSQQLVDSGKRKKTQRTHAVKAETTLHE